MQHVKYAAPENASPYEPEPLGGYINDTLVTARDRCRSGTAA